MPRVDLPTPELNRSVAATCPECKRAIAAPVKGSYFGTCKDLMPHHPGAEVQEFVLLECPTCEAPLVVNLEWSCIPGMEYKDWAVAAATQLYPRAARLGTDTPDNIRKIFDEAIICFENHAYRACALMCRATLEAICFHHGEKRKDGLADKLKALRKKNLIDEKLLAWATELNVLGNDAAHDVEAELSPEDAKYALAFTRSLSEQVFTLAKEFDAFKKRRPGP